MLKVLYINNKKNGLTVLPLTQNTVLLTLGDDKLGVHLA